MPRDYNFTTESRVRWTTEEWDRLAEELYCVRPTAQYRVSDSLASLTLEDMQEIQKILPKDRWRPLKTVTPVRPHMQAAMRRLRSKLKQLEERQHQEIAERNRQEAARKAAEEEAAKPNPYEAMFAPMIAFITSEVLKQVHAAMQHQAVPQEQPKPLPPAPPPLPDEQKRPKIGVIGPLGVQAEDIKRSYPDVDFVTVDSSQQRTAASKVVGCDLIIGMTDFMDRSTDSQMRSKFLNNYHRTSGSTSSVKRMIGVLLHSMGHQRRQQNMH